MHMLEKTFITIIHLAEWKMIAKADVIAVPPGTVGVCGQKHISYSHRSNSQTTDILCRLHPPQSSRSNASWKIFSSAREPKPLRGSYTKHPVNIRAMRAFLPVLLDTDKQWVCIHPCTAYHHVFYFLVLISTQVSFHHYSLTSKNRAGDPEGVMYAPKRLPIHGPLGS